MGLINSDILLGFNISQIVLAFIMGSCYEILGRRVTLVGFSLFIPLVLALIPYTAPNVYLLGLMKILCGVGFAA